ncbi:CRAL/TRIO domain-containing protein, partial [Conidiobolus coronatus NRRL 28638]
TVVFNMNGFTLANVDLGYMRMMTRMLSDHYPELLHRVLIHDAPWIFNSVWSVLCTFLDPVIKSKVIFSQDDQIKDYVDEDVLLSYLGGSNPYTHEYFPPKGNEGLIKPHDDEYSKLKGERAALLNKFEESTYNWIDSNEKAIKLKRDELANELASNHAKLDKYEYSGNIYRRLKVIKGYDNVNW